MTEYYAVWDDSDKHWEELLGLFTTEKIAEAAADTKRGYWRERYQVKKLPYDYYPQFSFRAMKEMKKMETKKTPLTAEERAELDTWGVWDSEEGGWVSGYSDFRGHYHERQNINQRHAENAALKMNGYIGDRYEARDMMLEKSVWEDETPSLTAQTIANAIADRKGTIAHLEDEIKALEMAAMLLGVK
jgi:hypothetical protein